MSGSSEKKRSAKIISIVIGCVACAGILLVLLSVPFVKTEGMIKDTMIIKNISIPEMGDAVSDALDGKDTTVNINVEEDGEIEGTYYVEFYHFGKTYNVQSHETMKYGISKKYCNPGDRVDVWYNPIFPDKIFKLDFK
ncbi:MAG: hypothetical protein J5715_07480 [Clostridiales bacterium]|nr:hypothetical protein [Clostridiales bacterium]